MSLKNLVSEMDGTHRSAFLLLEKKITESKMEVLRAIPPSKTYDDSHIMNKLNELEGNAKSLETNLKQIKEMKERVVEYQKNLVDITSYEKTNYLFHQQIVISLGDLFNLFADKLSLTNPEREEFVTILNKIGKSVDATIILKPKGQGSHPLRRLNELGTLNTKRAKRR